MFTWICPKCGKEVPPSYAECPECANPTVTVPEQGPVAWAPHVEAPPSARKRPQPPAESRNGLPVWLLTLLFALGFLALGASGFFAYRHFSNAGTQISRPASPAPEPPVAQSAPPAPAAPSRNVLLEFVEVTGLRLTEDKEKKLQVQFVVVNHSPAALTDLAGTVSLRPKTAKPGGGEPVATFAFRLPELAPYGSLEMKSPLRTKMRAYELPDWEYMRADLEITPPKPAP